MPQLRRSVFALCLVVVLLISTLGAGVGSVAAQSDLLPASYYGELTVEDGTFDRPVRIDAVADGEVQYSIITAANGSVGGPTVSDEKIEVQEPDDPSVEFQIAGEPVTIQTLDGDPVNAESIQWSSGTQEIVLRLDSVDAIPTSVDISITDTNSPVVAEDTVTVTAEIENTGDIEATPEVQLRNASDAVLDTSTSTIPIDGTTETTLSWTTTAADVGTTTLSVAVGAESASTTVEVEAPNIAEPDPGGSGGGGQGGGGQGGVPPGGSSGDDEPSSTTNTSIEGLVNTESQFIVSSDRFGISQVRFTNATALASITWDTSQIPGELVTVDTYNQSPAGVSPVPGEMLSVSDLSVPANASQPATIAFRADQTALAEQSIPPESVTIARLTNDSWEPLSTTVTENTTDTVIVEAETTGFSYFAVTTTTPTAVIDAPTSVPSGSDVTVSGVNSTTPFGEIVAYEWVIDGESRTGENITTQIDGETTVELTVENDAGETATTTTTLTPSSDDNTPGFGALTALVALLGSTLLAMRRRSQR